MSQQIWIKHLEPLWSRAQGPWSRWSASEWCLGESWVIMEYHCWLVVFRHPLKNMSSSVRMIIPIIYGKNMFQTANQWNIIEHHGRSGSNKLENACNMSSVPSKKNWRMLECRPFQPRETRMEVIHSHSAKDTVAISHFYRSTVPDGSWHVPHFLPPMVPKTPG